MYSKIALASVLLVSLTEGFLFPSGGGGCGCAPPPPPCQPISLPQPCLPQLPQPCLPPPPSFQLPSLPSCGGGCGGCGGRKKREATTADDSVKCTDPELRKIIIKNLGGDIEQTRETIQTAAQAHLNTKKVAVVCSADKKIDYAATVETFCIDGSEERTCVVCVAIVTTLAFQFVLFAVAFWRTLKDNTIGDILDLDDNKIFDEYHYLIMVDTSLKRGASSKARIHFSIFGSKQSVVDRLLFAQSSIDGENFRVFRWGARDRFLLRSRLDLGELKKLKLWTDPAGDHTWHCARVEILDLQTDKRYLFRVSKWISSESEYDIPPFNAVPVEQRSRIREAAWWHNLLPHVFYIAQLTAGGGRDRMLMNREYRVLYNTAGLVMGFGWITLYVQKLGNSGNKEGMLIFSIKDYDFTFVDVGVGFLATVIIGSWPYINLVFASTIQSTAQEIDYEYMSKWRKKLFYNGNVILNFVLVTIVCLGDFLIVGYVCLYVFTFATQCHYSDAVSVAKKYYLSLIFYILFEPVKAVIINYIVIRVNPDYKLIGMYEKFCLVRQIKDLKTDKAHSLKWLRKLENDSANQETSPAVDNVVPQR
uniref:PLAT domain-containing protein n=1 Tax=Panagrellus redivivus TaxID=6233 RepID=A0A7E4WA28_PANRE